jgi:acetate kinase
MRSASVLVFNAGSSSLKFELFENDATNELKSIIRGTVGNIGGQSSLDWSDGTTHAKILIEASDHTEAAEWVLDWLQHLWPFGSLLDHLDLVAHRVVHGGKHFCAPQLITDKVIKQLESLTRLAPLHNPKALAVMQVSREKLARKVQMIAVFDTAFFHDLPKHIGYALPESLTKQYGIKRFGFHGLAHCYMSQRYKTLAANHTLDSRIISFQLGHGCSVAAIRNGKPVDTSMGYTPLEGLMMATRAGDIDPGILIDLLRNGVELDELEEKLNHHSGLLGVAKSTADMRELLAQEDMDEDARLAIDMFCHRARKYLGAYMAILNGVDAILFGGGIGEHAPEIRQRICADMAWCGLQLDERLNHLASGAEMLISADKSKIRVYVIPVNEEILIAEDARTAAINLKSVGGSVIFADQKQWSRTC